MRILGIDLKVHLTFFLILIWGASWGAGAGVRGAIFGVVMTLALFVCVTLHEFGHALVARRFNVPVREIILLPIGGVAIMRRSPDKAVHELLIALAGPAVNVVLAGILWGIHFAVPSALMSNFTTAIVGKAPLYWAMLVPVLLGMNIALIVFNLIPAFPLDGGRVLRAILWMRMPMARATQIAASVGQVFAMLIGVWALMIGNWVLAIIAIFIFFGAGAESSAAQTVMVLSGRRVGDAYNRYALRLSLDDRVSRVIEYILTSYQPDFAVLHRGKLQGIVTREDVLRWVADNDYDVFVTEIMHEDIPHVDARLTLDQVVKQLQERQKRVAAVFDGQKFLGLVSAEDIAEAQLVLTFINRPYNGHRRGLHAVTTATHFDDANANAAPAGPLLTEPIQPPPDNLAPPDPDGPLTPQAVPGPQLDGERPKRMEDHDSSPAGSRLLKEPRS